MYCGWKGYKSQNCIVIQRGLYCDWAQLGAGLGRWAQQARAGGAGQACVGAQAGARAAGGRQQDGARGARRLQQRAGVERAGGRAVGARGAAGRDIRR